MSSLKANSGGTLDGAFPTSNLHGLEEKDFGHDDDTVTLPDIAAVNTLSRKIDVPRRLKVYITVPGDEVKGAEAPVVEQGTQQEYLSFAIGKFTVVFVS
ncbi:hypothetical protein RBB50_001248 [Rhinocladiella similis]